MSTWNRDLRELRRSRKVTTTELSRRSGISLASIRSYESGRRRPTRQRLALLLECLHADQPTQNVILAGAGFAPALAVGRYAERGLTRREAEAIVRQRPWPTLLVAGGHVLTANDVARQLLEAPLNNARARRSDNLTAAVRRAIGRRCDNWDELVAGTISAFKAANHKEASLDAPSPAVAPLLTAYCVGNRVLLARFAELWKTTPAFQPTYAGRSYRVVWRATGRTRILFEVVMSCVNTVTGLYVHNWIPVDARSHEALERLLAR